MQAIEKYKDMRAVYADTITDLAEEDEKIIVLEADLMAASGTKVFQDKFPDRLINVGVAEANMVGVASGLSSMGFIPFVNTFGCFAGRRVYDQFFISSNYAKQNVKLIGTDPGVTAKYNGGTHMPFEDIALMRAIPNLVIIEASDTISLHHLTRLCYEHAGCTYMRLHRKGACTHHRTTTTFKIGKGVVLQDGTDAAIFATGMVMVSEALKAAEQLSSQGIYVAVIDMHTIKPLDTELILNYAEKTGALITCENAQRAGGLGGAVAELLAETHPTPLQRVGVNDEFGEVGTQEYLQERFGLTAAKIVEKTLIAIQQK